MILRNVLELISSIEDSRKRMYNEAKEKVFSDLELEKISQELDRKLVLLQKIISRKIKA